MQVQEICAISLPGFKIPPRCKDIDEFVAKMRDMYPTSSHLDELVQLRIGLGQREVGLDENALHFA